MTRTFNIALPVLTLALLGAATSPQYACPGAQQGGCAMAQPAKAAKAAPVKAKTPQQKAYLAEAARLHGKIVATRAELTALQAKGKPSPASLKAKQGQVDAARKALHAYNVKNKAVRAEMGLKDCSTCPKAGLCDGCPGTGCEQCADCPVGGAGCGLTTAAPKAKPAAKAVAGGCPMHKH